MKVSHFNTFPYGGAATAATRIHHQLNHFCQNDAVNDAVNDAAQHASGWSSQFCYYRDDRDSQTPPLDESYFKVEFSDAPASFIQSMLEGRREKRRQRDVHRQFDTHLATRSHAAETFSMADLPEPTRLNWSAIGADIAHLHWISFFADYRSFFGSIPDSVPVVWTLHDMNAFTGGCHYSNLCDQFRSGCGDCPQVENRTAKDVSRSGFDSKRRALAKKNIHVVTPSRWLNRLAQQSPIWPAGTTFQTIPYGFDTDRMRPVAKQEARRKLGIDSGAVLIGFGADDVNNRRKGIQHLLGALRIIQAEQPQVTCPVPPIAGLLFGAGEINDADSVGLPAVHQMGYVDSIEQQRLIYSAADIVVVPSREDNQPQIGLEAMACGTPVVGFDVGGIPEYVRDGETGLLAAVGDEVQLADRIALLASDVELRNRMGRNARAMIEAEFGQQRQAQDYLHLYESVLGYREIIRAA